MKNELSKAIFRGNVTEYFVDKLGNIFNKYGKRLRYKDDDHHYYHFTLYYKGKPYNAMVHRVVAETYIQNPDNCPVVNHLDGNTHNNAVWNLEWVEYSRNTQHAYDTGLIRMKITNEQIREASKMFLKGKTASYIAKTLGVNLSVIQSIKSGKAHRVIAGEVGLNFDKKYSLNSGSREKRIKDMKLNMKVPSIYILGSFNDDCTSELWSPRIVWKGYKLPYRVSNYGRVVNVKSMRIQVPEINNASGYPRVGLYVTELQKSIMIPVKFLVAHYFLENPDPEKYNQLYEKDGDIYNCRADNLEWTNNKLRSEKDPLYHVSDNILSVKDVHKICKYIASGKYKYPEIASRFHVKPQVIAEIANRRTWKNVSKEYIFPPRRQKKFLKYYDKIDGLLKAGLRPKDIIQQLPIEGANEDSYRNIINNRKKDLQKLGFLKKL